jgi:uncharacterized protein involved in exopolysaccharide biosynthesis
MSHTEGPPLPPAPERMGELYRWDPMPPTNGNGPEPSLRELTIRVTSRRRLLASVALVTFAATAAYTLLTTPRYRSEARLRIDTETQQSGMLSALSEQAGSMPGASLLGLGRDELETEIAVLRSDRISDATIDSLGLNVVVKNPAASRSAVLTARIVSPDADVDGKLTFTRLPNAHYRIDRNDLDDVPGIPSEIAPGVPLNVGGTVLTLRRELALGGPSNIVVKFLPRYKVHKLLDKRLIIARQEGGSRLVDVSYEDPDRALAARVVSTLIGEYVTYTNTTAHGLDTTAVAELRFQVDSTARKLAASEAALRSFEEQARIIAPEEQAKAEITRMSLMSAKVDQISAERNALARMLTVIDQRSRGGSNPTAYRQLATFPSLITNKAIQDLLQTLVTLENKRDSLGVSRTAQNADYKAITDRIVEIERQLYSVGPAYLESLDQQLSSTASTVAALSDTMRAMPAAATQYVRLLRDRTLGEAIYLALQKQLKQAELKDVLRPEKVRVVDIPRVANADDPAFPKKAVMLPLGALLGIVLALAVGLFAEMWQGSGTTVITESGLAR